MVDFQQEQETISFFFFWGGKKKQLGSNPASGLVLSWCSSAGHHQHRWHRSTLLPCNSSQRGFPMPVLSVLSSYLLHFVKFFTL